MRMFGFSVMNGTEGEDKCHSYASEISRRMHTSKTKEAALSAASRAFMTRNV
jgi:hypothetical protein